MARKKLINADPWLEIASLADLKEEVERRAKRANQRLREIEKQGLEESSLAYRAIERYVYDKKAGYKTTREGHIAFSRSYKEMTREQLQQLYYETGRFLEATTSTVSGYKSALERSYAGYSKTKSYAKLSFEEYKRFWEAESVKTYGYASIQTVMKSTKKGFSQIEKVMNQAVAEQANLEEKLKTKDLIERVKHPEYYDANGNWRPPKKGQAKTKKKR